LSCKRSTRSTGRGDNEHSQLCEQCFDLGGETNSLSDNGELFDAKAAQSSMFALIDKGIDAINLFPEIAEALNIKQRASTKPITSPVRVVSVAEYIAEGDKVRETAAFAILACDDGASS
jgi:hypothetical protein